MKIISLLGLSLFLVSCGKTDPPHSEDYKFNLRAVSFARNDSIPYIYSCKSSKQKFPGFTFEKLGTKFKSMVLIMDDPDAVPVAGKIWNHWVLYNIPSSAGFISEGQDQYGPLPAGTFRGTTSFGDTAYGGPCPPVGQKHTYVFTLYGVDKADLGLPRAATSAEVRAAMKGHVMDSSVYKGTFMR
jgi:Raf kinase inhibitor-like YbhB/YbcL family protein